MTAEARRGRRRRSRRKPGRRVGRWSRRDDELAALGPASADPVRGAPCSGRPGRDSARAAGAVRRRSGTGWRSPGSGRDASPLGRSSGRASGRRRLLEADDVDPLPLEVAERSRPTSIAAAAPVEGHDPDRRPARRSPSAGPRGRRTPSGARRRPAPRARPRHADHRPRAARPRAPSGTSGSKNSQRRRARARSPATRRRRSPVRAGPPAISTSPYAADDHQQRRERRPPGRSARLGGSPDATRSPAPAGGIRSRCRR